MWDISPVAMNFMCFAQKRCVRFWLNSPWRLSMHQAGMPVIGLILDFLAFLVAMVSSFYQFAGQKPPAIGC
jgi:hypothetical protein